MAVALDEDEGRQLLREHGWPEEIIAADDGVTETVVIRRDVAPLEGDQRH